MSMYDSGGHQPQGLSEFDDRQAGRLCNPPLKLTHSEVEAPP